MAHLEKEYPDSNKGRSARLVPIRDAIVGDIRPTLLVLQAEQAFVADRLREPSESAAGPCGKPQAGDGVARSAGRLCGRLIRQFMTEGVFW